MRQHLLDAAVELRRQSGEHVFEVGPRVAPAQLGTCTVRMYLYSVAHFAHWTHLSRVGVRDIADDVVLRFVEEHLPRCTCSSPVQRCRHQVRAALRQLLIALVDADVLISIRQPDAIEDQLDRFDGHMKQARGS